MVLAMVLCAVAPAACQAESTPIIKSNENAMRFNAFCENPLKTQ
jgi:hypothetical protein